MKVLSLFSGIGGFDIGLERAGMQTVAFCEFDPYCQAVLRRHWPGVPIYDDVRALSADTLRRDGVWPIDVIAGGFPCQDLSYAGKRAGIEGERSGLWSEFARLIGEVRPRFAIMENVPGLLSAGHGRVLGDLAALGYDAVWDCVPASAVGDPHRRDRVWIIAHAQHPNTDIAGLHRAAQHVGDSEPGDKQVSQPRPFREVLAHANSTDGAALGLNAYGDDERTLAAVRSGPHSEPGGVGAAMAHANSTERKTWEPVTSRGGSCEHREGGVTRGGADVAHAQQPRLEGHGRRGIAQCIAGGSQDVADADNPRLENGGVRKCVDPTRRQVPPGHAAECCDARGASIPDASLVLPQGRGDIAGERGRAKSANAERRQPEPGLGGVADGLPHWVDASAWLEEPEGVPRVATGIENRAARLKALGNSIVPQVAYLIGQAVMESTR